MNNAAHPVTTVGHAGLTRTTFRNTAIPNEHGGWMFLLEPALIGLASAFSVTGLLLSLAALGAFLARHPLKLALDDHLRGRRVPRTRWAELFTAIYVTFAVVMGAVSVITAEWPFVLPLLLAAPLAVVQGYLDATRRGRSLAAELCGAIAMGSTASSIALLAGWHTAPAYSLWLIVVSRAVTSIPYVRTRLRLERGRPVSRWPVWLVHVCALMLTAAMALYQLVPWSATAAAFLWAARAVVGLAPFHRPVRAQTVGIQEVVVGLVSTLTVVSGYWLAW